MYDVVGSTELEKTSNAVDFENTRKLFTSSGDLAGDSVVDESALSDSNSEPVTCKTCPSTRSHRS